MDAIWIEDLNTILNDNKIRTLTDGDWRPMSDNVKMIFDMEMMVNVFLDEPKVLLSQKMNWQTNKKSERAVYLSNVQLMIHQDQYLHLFQPTVLVLIGGSYRKMNLTWIEKEKLSTDSAAASLHFPA